MGGDKVKITIKHRLSHSLGDTAHAGNNDPIIPPDKVILCSLNSSRSVTIEQTLSSDEADNPFVFCKYRIDSQEQYSTNNTFELPIKTENIVIDAYYNKRGIPGGALMISFSEIVVADMNTQQITKMTVNPVRSAFPTIAWDSGVEDTYFTPYRIDENGIISISTTTEQGKSRRVLTTMNGAELTEVDLWGSLSHPDLGWMNLICLFSLDYTIQFSKLSKKTKKKTLCFFSNNNPTPNPIELTNSYIRNYYEPNANATIQAVYVVPLKVIEDPARYTAKGELMEELIQQIQLLGQYAIDGPGLELIFREGKIIVQKIPEIGPKLMNDLAANHSSLIHHARKLEEAIRERNKLLGK